MSDNTAYRTGFEPAEKKLCGVATSPAKRITFEPNVAAFDKRVGERGADTVVIVDAHNPPAGALRLSTHQWAIQADLAAHAPDAPLEFGQAETIIAAEQAQTLTRVRPDRVLVAECSTHLQAQFVVEMAARGMTVTVATGRNAFLALVDDVETARKYIDAAR